MKDNSEQLSILHIITGLGMGGAEKVVYDLCKHSIGTQYNMQLVCLSDLREREQEFKDLNIPLHFLNLKKNVYSIIKAIRYIKTLINKENIDVIHVHMVHGLLITNFLSWPLKIPVVFTAHSYNVGNKLREWYLCVTKPFRSVDILFSKSQLQYYHKKKQHEIIPNGIDLEPFDSIREKTEKFNFFTFVHVGRLIDLKNQELIIRSAKVLKDKKIPFQLLIAGDGENKEYLNNLIEDLQLKNQVKLLGLISDVPTLLIQSHVFVLSSYWEGFPISILEAGAARIPVISTPVGGIPDIITDKCGILTEASSYAKSMESMYNLYVAKYKKYGQNLYDKITLKYSMKQVFEKHIELYGNILDR